MDLIGKKKIFIIISIIAILPGLFSLAVYGLKLSIDFTGGSVFEFSYQENVKKEDVALVFKEANLSIDSIFESGDKKFTIKTALTDNAKNDEIKSIMGLKFKDSSETSFETIGPTIGKETTQNAFLAVVVASIGILLYIAYSFRGIPKPYSSFRFGASAIVALLHDAFLVLGLFSILGHFKGVEVNSLFITAVLTVIGFSVHDTIVVFDRIRENLEKIKGKSFSEVVNYSLVETLNRSLRTSLTVIFTLLTLLLLGGESIKYFVIALLVGIVSGTYSSIFNAAPILVVWEEAVTKRTSKR